MDSKSGVFNTNPLPKEHKIIPKIEPIDVNFIKKEEIEEECSVEPGVTVSLKVDKVLVKEELCENEETGKYSSSIVRINFILFYDFLCNFSLVYR